MKPVYVESRTRGGEWTREGLNAPGVSGGHYAYPSREAAKAMIPNLQRDLGVVDDDEVEFRIVEAEEGAIVE